MSEAQAGTPAKPEETSGSTQNSPAPQDGSEKDAQKWQEALKWKQKAEDYNKVETELAAERAKNEELTRLAYSGGRQATDPRAELVAKLQEQAQYDPASAAALINMRETLEAKAEVWLANGLLHVPDAKREQVAQLIRANGYQLSHEAALKMVTDPETLTLAERLKAVEQENERLKSSRPNGVSPSAVTPANASRDDGQAQETIKRSDYLAALKRGDDAARALMQAVGTNKTKLIND